MRALTTLSNMGRRTIYESDRPPENVIILGNSCALIGHAIFLIHWYYVSRVRAGRARLRGAPLPHPHNALVATSCLCSPAGGPGFVSRGGIRACKPGIVHAGGSARSPSPWGIWDVVPGHWLGAGGIGSSAVGP
jgi:hypothetical protein